MTSIERWNAAFAAMDDRARNELLMMAETMAMAHPRRKTGRLSLVSPSVMAVRPAQHLGHPEHVFTPALVSSVK